ncbi:hypothetical protein pb186bvf_006785 [Paramecium bursaria]
MRASVDQIIQKYDKNRNSLPTQYTPSLYRSSEHQSMTDLYIKTAYFSFNEFYQEMIQLKAKVVALLETYQKQFDSTKSKQMIMKSIKKDVQEISSQYNSILNKLSHTETSIIDLTYTDSSVGKLKDVSQMSNLIEDYIKQFNPKNTSISKLNGPQRSKTQSEDLDNNIRQKLIQLQTLLMSKLERNPRQYTKRILLETLDKISEQQEFKKPSILWAQLLQLEKLRNNGFI